jgi:hypothetical protein
MRSRRCPESQTRSRARVSLTASAETTTASRDQTGSALPTPGTRRARPAAQRRYGSPSVRSSPFSGDRADDGHDEDRTRCAVLEDEGIAHP